jgi:hypothetical protein
MWPSRPGDLSGVSTLCATAVTACCDTPDRELRAGKCLSVNARHDLDRGSDVDGGGKTHEARAQHLERFLIG